MFTNKTCRLLLLSLTIIIILSLVIGCDIDTVSDYNGEDRGYENDDFFYRTGISHFEYEDYEHAIKYLSNVPIHSKHYKDAVKKIKEAEKLVGKQQQRKKEDEKESKYQMGIELIKECKWDDATVKLVFLKDEKYKDSYILYAYASAEEEIIKNHFGTLMHYLEYIPDDYQGDLAETILARKKEILENKDELRIEMEAKAKIMAKERLREEAILERISFKWYKSSRSYVRAEGEVKNISGVPLRNVMAVVTYKTNDDDFITYDSALIEYNPIMPDQISPFRIITPYNPLMEVAYLEFQFLSGERIPYYFE
jgi:hypothetical protein